MSASERRIRELEEETRELRGEIASLRHLLKSQMRTGEMLEFEAIVNREATPLVNLRWDQLATQVSPEEARGIAHDLLRVAEWASCDAVILTAAREAFEDERMAGAVMAMLREARGGSQERAA